MAILGSAILGIYRGVFKVCGAGGGDLEIGTSRPPSFKALVWTWLSRHLWLLMPASIRV